MAQITGSVRSVHFLRHHLQRRVLGTNSFQQSVLYQHFCHVSTAQLMAARVRVDNPDNSNFQLILVGRSSPGNRNSVSVAAQIAYSLHRILSNGKIATSEWTIKCAALYRKRGQSVGPVAQWPLYQDVLQHLCTGERAAIVVASVDRLCRDTALFAFLWSSVISAGLAEVLVLHCDSQLFCMLFALVCDNVTVSDVFGGLGDDTLLSAVRERVLYRLHGSVSPLNDELLFPVSFTINATNIGVLQTYMREVCAAYRAGFALTATMRVLDDYSSLLHK